MADIHIDDFYHDCAWALLRLYSQFPRRESLYVEDIVGPQGVDEYGIPTARHRAGFATLIWLGDEGYLRYSGVLRQDSLDQAVLTETAFIRLSSLNETAPENDSDLPELVHEQRHSLAQALREALDEGSSLALKNAMRRFFIPA